MRTTFLFFVITLFCLNCKGQVYIGLDKNTILDSMSKKDVWFEGVKYGDNGRAYLLYYTAKNKQGVQYNPILEISTAFYLNDNDICFMVLKIIPLDFLDSIVTSIKKSENYIRGDGLNWVSKKPGRTIEITQDRKNNWFSLILKGL